MECPRCHGMMVYEQIFTTQGRLHVARCIHCGDIIDDVVISNRRRPNFHIKKIFRGCNAVASIAG